MQDPKEIKKKKIIVQALAGASASISNQILHPLDLIKARFQSNDSGPKSQNVVPQYKSLLDSFRKIIRDEGRWALFRGVTFSLIGNNLSYGLFFAMYERNRQYISKHLSSEFQISFLASSGAAFIGSMIVQPVWVLKTRRLLDSKGGGDIKRSKDLAKEVWRQHGFPGFYRGFALSLALGLYGTIQITSYSTIKDFVVSARSQASNDIETLGETQKPQFGLKSYEIITLGMVSRLISSAFLHPLTTVRTRYQQNQFFEGIEGQKYVGILDTFKKTYAKEGVKGFYKGIVPMTAKALPAQGLFFFIYENVKKGSSEWLGVEYQKTDPGKMYEGKRK